MPSLAFGMGPNCDAESRISVPSQSRDRSRARLALRLEQFSDIDSVRSQRDGLEGSRIGGAGGFE